MNDKNLPDERVNAAITEILKEIGMSAGLNGYECVRYGIWLASKDTKVLCRMMRDFYPAVAKRFDITASSAERAIRYAIERAFYRCPTSIAKKYFGNTMSISSGKPTNREFISMLANYIQIKGGTVSASWHS